jgi:uncharacterized protein (DUF952 family)
MQNPSNAEAGAVASGHRTLHLTPTEVWRGQQDQPAYRPEAFAADGFIHCTDDAEELMNAGNRYYREDPRPYIALTINCDLLTAPVIYEDAARIYPHIYGLLDTKAVERAQAVRRDGKGAFVAVESAAVLDQ